MRSLAILCAAVAAAGLVVSAAQAAPKPNDEAQIRALAQQFADAIKARDVDAVMKVYVPDDSLFVFDLVPPRQYVGAAAYRKDWQTFFASFKGPIAFEVNDLAVSTDGTIGYGHSIQHVSGTDPKGNPVDMTVRVTDIYRKVEGHWLVVQEHVSVPIDLETGKPDMMSRP